MAAKISPQFSQQQPQEREPITLNFRAPPPSPIASSRRASSVTNEEVLTEFLEHSLRVPDLILPDRIFPRQKPLADVPALDFRAHGSSAVSEAMDSLAGIGCFQVINHGISPELIASVENRAGRIFHVSPEKRRLAVRSQAMPLGYEEVNGDQEEFMSEEFVWGRDYGLKLKMEGIWPTGYSNFSEEIDALALEIEKVAKEIMMMILHENEMNNISYNDGHKLSSTICHIYNHPGEVAIEQCISSLRYDVIRMMIRGSDYSHALSLHICDGSSEFHVYSKKGWVSFTPLENALVVTAGDLLQAWSGGRYKHVIGRPIYTSKNEDCISMAFLYSPAPPPPVMNESFHQEKQEKIISFREQALFAILFTIFCQILLHIYSKW